MTRKIYKSAMGKTVDMGALLLQNEHVRAVGNMNVNARGDILDSSNQVIDSKNRQAQRQYQRNSNNVSSDVVHTSTRSAKQNLEPDAPVVPQAVVPQAVVPPPPVDPVDTFETLLDSTEPETDVAEPEVSSSTPPAGGLAAAIARSRTIKQEKELTAREKAQQQPLRKI